MLGLKFIALSITGIAQEVVVGVLLFVIFNLEINWRKVLKYATIMGLTSSISNVFLPQSNKYASLVYMIVFIASAMLSIMFLYKFSFLKSLSTVCIVYFLKTIVTLTCLPIFKLLFREGFNATNASLFEQVTSQIIALTLLLLITMIISLFKIKIHIPEDLGKKRALTVVINIVLSVLLLFPNLIYIQEVMNTRSTPLLIYNSVSLIFVVVLNVVNFLRLGEMEFLKENAVFQELYIKTLNEMIDSLRGFKHDHNNMMQVISGYIAAQDMDGLKKFHSQMMSESRKLNNIIPLNSYIKHNPPIYGLLLSKISYSEIKNINLTINVMCKVEFKNIKIYDMCKILGVLLDNAIEAAFESEKKYVELAIRENANKSCLFIEVNNSYSGTVDVESIFKDGYTTKKDHSGFGLWEIQKIINKYKNCKLHTHARENSFSQRIEITY
ncbi:MAG: Sensor histidine kinase CitA [Firmicutes bacterium ADurb.Bin419]|nr:MAG: Sensor histidine kinase CitA [Firmicutes bacterium ADurb.Bin419]